MSNLYAKVTVQSYENGLEVVNGCGSWDVFLGDHSEWHVDVDEIITAYESHFNRKIVSKNGDDDGKREFLVRLYEPVLDIVGASMLFGGWLYDLDDEEEYDLIMGFKDISPLLDPDNHSIIFINSGYSGNIYDLEGKFSIMQVEFIAK